VFLVLMAVRVLDKRRWLNAWALLALALLAVPLTAALEALWYGLATGVPWRRILDANLMLALAPRPALVVGMIALSLPLLALLRPRPSAAGTRRATV
jgi:sulfoxide reductase heme-binding subunit YedZ